MSRWRRSVPIALLGLLLVTPSGCGVPRSLEEYGLLGRWLAHRRESPAPPPAPQAFDPDATEIPWARDEPYFVVVSHTCHRLDVFRWGQLIRRYPAVFGMNPAGTKVHEGDLRTPRGFYRIVKKRPHRRWARFLLLDYPNATDVNRYVSALEAGTLPLKGNRAPGIGGEIGIHGSDKEDLNVESVDWTYGCISLTNRDIIELDELVPVGTPVLIED